MEHTDNETGELLPNVHYTVDELNAFDLETGETDTNTPTILQRKTRFTIPKELIKPSADEDSKKCCCIDPNETFTLCKKEEVINLQEEIILGYNKTSHRLFLIPSLFVFARICAPLILLVEIYLHVWAHRKNSRNTNANIYYRSPLHIITAQFCANCRNHSDMEQVSKLQDKRLKSWRQHLRNMARSMY